MPNGTLFPQYIANIVGELDTTDMVPIDPDKKNLSAIHDASEAAMKQLLATDMVDFYLLSNRTGSPNAVRYSGVPFNTRGVMILPGADTITQATAPVWIEDNPDTVSYLVEDASQGMPALLSSVAPALMFRQRFGTTGRRLELSPELGSITFTPQFVDVGWRPAQPSGAGTPWYRFDYLDLGISNDVAVAGYDTSFGTWLWFTDPETSEPEDPWWKVSHIVNHVNDGPAYRIDDPVAPPPRRPSRLSIQPPPAV